LSCWFYLSSLDRPSGFSVLLWHHHDLHRTSILHRALVLQFPAHAKMLIRDLLLLVEQLEVESMLGLRFFCSLFFEFCSDIGGTALCLSNGCSSGSAGFNEPGSRISKPVPWPRTTADFRLSKDVRSGGGNFSSAAPAEAGIIGLVAPESIGLWVSLLI